VVTGGQVLPKGFAGVGSDVDEALFAFSASTAAFADDKSGASLEVAIGEAEVAEFSGADAGVQKEVDDGFVAQGDFGRAGGTGVRASLPGGGIFGGPEQGLDFVSSEGFDDGRVGVGWGDVTDDVVVGVAFAGGPGPEGG